MRSVSLCIDRGGGTACGPPQQLLNAAICIRGLGTQRHGLPFENLGRAEQRDAGRLIRGPIGRRVAAATGDEQSERSQRQVGEDSFHRVRP